MAIEDWIEDLIPDDWDGYEHEHQDDAFPANCDLCGHTITMTPTVNGWKPMDLNGKPHVCPERARENLSVMPDLTEQ